MMVMAFLNYLYYSKHLHIILAFPSAYFSSLQPAGKMKNMPSVQNEVLYAMQPELAPTDAAAPATDARGCSAKRPAKAAQAACLWSSGSAAHARSAAVSASETSPPAEFSKPLSPILRKIPSASN